MAQKVEAQRGVEGDVWDDGFYDGVRKVHVGQGQDGVSFINAVYEKGSQEVEGGEHGNTTLLGFETFEVDADDYIIKQWRSHTVQGSLSTLSIRDRKKFVLKEKNGGKLLGFHGRAGEVLHALGAYFVTTTTPLTPAKKLPAVGGDGGTALDDGAYDGVRKLFVGQAQDGISVVKFAYAKGAEEIIRDEHGNMMLGVFKAPKTNVVV
ncbi:BnaA01g28050D [Brassica napus]|uniref:BnaA01g28050D protein n=1 Tax=Brassica napus TaxID=3708 RepID=A0A078G5F2_BRANA|nr:BnaA01g28050D [Brassica napus]